MERHRELQICKSKIVLSHPQKLNYFHPIIESNLPYRHARKIHNNSRKQTRQVFTVWRCQFLSIAQVCDCRSIALALLYLNSQKCHFQANKRHQRHQTFAIINLCCLKLWELQFAEWRLAAEIQQKGPWISVEESLEANCARQDHFVNWGSAPMALTSLGCSMIFNSISHTTNLSLLEFPLCIEQLCSHS